MSSQLKDYKPAGRHGLQITLNLILVSVVTILLVAFGGYDVLKTKQSLNAAFDKNSETYSYIISKKMVFPLWEIDEELANDEIQFYMTSDQSISWIKVVDAKAGSNFTGWIRESNGDLAENPNEYPNNDYTIRSKEITKNEQIIGHVEIAFTKDIVAKELARYIFVTFSRVLMIDIILILILSLVIRLKIIMPLRRIELQLRDFSKGRINQEMVVNNNNEIGTISNAFNDMALDLESTTISKDEVNNIMSTMNDALIVYDIHTRINAVNEAACDLLGYTKDELLGAEAELIIDSEEIFHCIRSVKIIKGEKLFNHEMTYKTKAGELIPVLVSAAVLRTKTGELEGIVTSGKDITDRKLAENEIKKLNQKNKLILDSAGEGIYGLDLEGNTTFINPVGAQLIGWKQNDLIGRSQHSILHHTKADGAKYPREDCPIYASLRDGKVHHVDTEVFWKKDGTSFPVEYTSTPIVEDGRITGVVVTYKDITLRKKYEQDLKKAKETADAGSLAKSQFLANMSHEIRTPLNAIIGFSRLLENSQLKEEQKKKVSIIVSSGEGLLGVINDILDFSKIEANERKLETIDFNFERLIRDCVAITSAKIKAGSEVELYCEYPKGLPKELRGDPTAVRQVLLNLMSNSIKFTKKGSVGIIVEEEAESNSKSKSLRIIVRDTGIGIPADKVDHIFGSFNQVDDTTTRTYGGTGLGLAITKSLIELMRGTIHVESEVGKGSKFIVSITLEEAKVSIVDQIDPVDLEVLNGKQVMIVDDNKFSRDLLRVFSEDVGMTVLNDATVGNGVLNFLANCNPLPQLIIIDITTPSTDGYALAKEIKMNKTFNDIKLICVSSDAAPGEAAKSKEAGFDAYLPKPLMKQDFIQVIQATLGDKRINGPIINRHLSQEIMKGIKILVVEDNVINQELIKALLNEMGCDIEIANNGLEAVEKVKDSTTKYQIIFMDLQMPKMGGLEATKIIRSDLDKRIPIIALTAAVTSEDKAASLEAGMNDFLTKPIQVDQLEEIIAKWEGFGKQTPPATKS
jgi:two-component system sensor histidine kinase/response regulator